MREQWVWEKKYNLNDGWSEGGVMEKGTETCLRQPMKRKALESQKRVQAVALNVRVDKEDKE